MEFGRKRGAQDAAAWNGFPKRSKSEMDSIGTGVGSKSKPCMKFFSTSGCQFGEGCHFLHYVPGGYSAVGQMTNHGGPTARNPGLPSFADAPSPTLKTKICTKYNSPEGCKFGDKCRFAHKDEFGRPGFEDRRSFGSMPQYGRRAEAPSPGLAAAANFGSSATAKISIDASLAGPIIGKGGVNSKQICRETGVKLAIRDHDTDPNQRNIELEGNFEQIKIASDMVHELIMNLRAATGGPARNPRSMPMQAPPANNFKTKMCENFAKGSCTFGDRCHFAHGPNELRKTAP
ncbi:hypothetical protein DCAR_0728691 [Daucus carota subsp. sativus]|uniref:C3H1-type domain-containing protein n=1 Tax=Daucus carota subsp. sativus TaxID=79200 RepID=A0AAF0XK31_DAUCS|nr:PREDICTED: zinc finger CCCH domain-containing protein 14-like [Daucus carota subsp. sativus]WOH09235.1 hypothetical protein DCAR_0728691 [Daucus carota subsp. sativus]